MKIFLFSLILLKPTDHRRRHTFPPTLHYTCRLSFLRDASFSGHIQCLSSYMNKKTE